MKSVLRTRERYAGMTLVEAVMYVALLSCLLGVFIPYAYAIHERDMRLLDQIETTQTSE